MIRTAVLLWPIAAMLVACGTILPWPTADLPTMAADTGGCRGVGLEATLAGDPTDPRVAWLIDDQGRRHDLIWPPGYTARFSPELHVIDAAGALAFLGGERIDGACTAGGADDPTRLLVIRPDP
jgi:hypothetical protein